MSDPIERLSRLGSACEGGPMLPPEEIRRRGDRIRRRRTALVAAGSAAAVAVVAVPVLALTGGGGSDVPPAGTDPALSEADLLTDAETQYTPPADPDGADWFTVDTFSGDGQSVFHPCAEQSLSALGATAVFQRAFELRAPDSKAVPEDWMTQAVAQFPDADSARAAYDTVGGWVTECDAFPESDRSSVNGPNAVDLRVAGEAEAYLSMFAPVPESIDPFGDSGYFVETGLTVIGDRLSVITSVIVGQDYNFVDGTPVERMIPAAAGLLLPGGEEATPTVPDDTPSETTGTERPDAGDWPARLPDDFPLASGLPEPASDETFDPPGRDLDSMLAAGELGACGSSPVARAATDRLTTRLTGPDSGTTREVQLFADSQEAVTYVAHLRDLYQSCPTEDSGGTPPTFTTTVGEGTYGDEALDIRRASDGIGRDVITVVRIGNAVLVERIGDAGAGDQVDDLATQAHENLADVMGAMNELMGGESSGDPGAPDVDAPAGTTEVPEDFPLDAGADRDGVAVAGPDRFENGVFPTTICGEDLATLAQPFEGSQLGYRETDEGEGGHGRTIRAYPTVQAAIDEMEQLRAQLDGCESDTAYESTEERSWRVHPPRTGYQEITFSYLASPDSAPYGVAYSAVRVGNAILVVEESGEWSTATITRALPLLAASVESVAPEMQCVFGVDGC